MRHSKRKARGDFSRVARLYALRMALYRASLGEKNFKHLLQAEERGDGPEADAKQSRSAQRRLHYRLKAELRRLERDNGPWPGNFGRNMRYLRQTLDLEDVSLEILGLLSLLRVDPDLDREADQWGTLTYPSLLKLFSVALRMDTDTVDRALAPDATLHRSGLARVDMRPVFALDAAVDVMEELVQWLFMYHETPESLFRPLFRPAPAPTLSVDDYPHHAGELRLLVDLLRSGAGPDPGGVNVLLYGEPGCGKTELARVTASECGRALYEVPTEDGAGEPINGQARLKAVRFAQAALSPTAGNLLLFDEAEDAFPGALAEVFPLFGRPQGKLKGWINQLLESNAVPTVWISNRVAQMDPAFVRRFDMVLEVHNPPRDRRRHLAARELGELHVREETIDRIADAESISPALITRAAAVTRFQAQGTELQDGTFSPDHTVLRLLSNSLRAMGHDGHIASGVPADYDPALANATQDLDKLAGAIAEQGTGRFCLCGPPGTGKTGFARHVARRANRPLLSRRGSELLSAYVGETEKNLRVMFEQAARENAVLLLDEVDGLLSSRAGARQRWELTQVNELLVAIERFEGILFAATNLEDRLDPAARRRFDMHVEFHYLDRERRRAMLQRTLARLGEPLDNIPGWAAERLDALENLAPGDFSMIERRSRFIGQLRTLAGFLEALEAESAGKRAGPSRPIGFLAAV